MIVQPRDLDPALGQLHHHRAHLGLCQDEIAHHHGATLHRFEGEPGTQRQGRFQLDPVERYVQIGARQSDAVDAARRYRSRLAERLRDLRPVDLGTGRK